MPHVGLEVVEDPDFDGSVAAMRKPFLFMVRNFVELMFNQKLEPKMVNGRKVRPRQGGGGHFFLVFCVCLVCTCLSQARLRVPTVRLRCMRFRARADYGPSAAELH